MSTPAYEDLGLGLDVEWEGLSDDVDWRDLGDADNFDDDEDAPASQDVIDLLGFDPDDEGWE